MDLIPEVMAIKVEGFEEGFQKNYRCFPETGDSFLRLVSYMAGQMREGIWRTGDQFEILLTAHMVRLLHRMGVSLFDRWNLALAGRREKRGNLYRASRMIILDAFHKPNKARWAWWGDDLWDDCYILLALQEVKDELGREEIRDLDRGLFGMLHNRMERSIKWLKEQVEHGLAVPDSEWFGPGFHAAIIELLCRQARAGDGEASDLLAKVVGSVSRLFLQGEQGSAWWKSRLFAWHIGQVIVAWKRNRTETPSCRSLMSSGISFTQS
jgi:hypothetical protein